MDVYQKFLYDLKNGLAEIEANPKLQYINGVPRTSFDLLVRSFRTNLDPSVIGGYPHNLSDQTYCQHLISLIDQKIGSYPTSGKLKDVTQFVKGNLPNLYNLVPAYQDALQAAEAGKVIFASQTVINQQIDEYNQRLIYSLKSSLRPEERDRHDREIAEIAARVSDNFRSKAVDSLHLSSQDEKHILDKAVEELAVNFKSAVLVFDEKIAKTAVETITKEALDAVKGEIPPPNAIRNYQVRKAWADIETALVANLSSPVPPPLLNFAVSQVAYDMTRAGVADLDSASYKYELEKSINAVLQSPVINYAVVQNPFVKELADNISSSVNNLSGRYGKLSEAKHAALWQFTAKRPDVAIQMIVANESLDSLPLGNAAGIPGTAAPPAGTVGSAAPSPSGGGSFSTLQVATEDPALQLFMASGAPANIIFAALDPNADLKLLQWVKNRPKSFFKGPFKIIPGFLSDSDYNDLIRFTGSSLHFYTNEMAKFVGQPPDSLSPADYYSFMAATQAQKVLDEIIKLRNAPGFAGGAFKTYDFYQFWRHPISSFKMRLMNHGLLPYSLAELATSIPAAYARYGGLGGAWVTEQYLKNFAMLGIKALFAKTGLYKVYRYGPMRYQYEFVPWHSLKVRIKKAIWNKVQPFFVKFAAKTIGKFTIGALTGGFGIAVGILGIIQWPLKKLAKGLGLLLGGLIAKYGMSFIHGLVPGALIGTGVGIWVGIKLGAAMGAAIGSVIIPGLGTVAGGIVGGVIGGFIGFFTGSFIGGFLSVWLESTFGWGTASSSVATQGSSLLSSITSAPIVNAASIPVVAIGGITALSVYTIFVASSAFFSPAGHQDLLGSQYIEIKKAADVAGQKESSSFENSITGPDQKVVYEVNVYPKGAVLKNVVIVDKTTSRNKDKGLQPITNYEVMGKDENGKYVFDRAKPNPERWDKNNDSSLNEIALNSQWKKFYGFELTKDYQDSIINNTVTVTAEVDGKTETKTITLSFKIGTPPLHPNAIAAENLLIRLTSCVNPPFITSSSYNEVCVQNQNNPPAGITFKDMTIKQITDSFVKNNWDNLQCGVFAVASTIESGFPLAATGNALDYYGKDASGYLWKQNVQDESKNYEFKNVQSGDIFVSQRPPYGHLAVVYDTNANGFWVIEALGDTGLVQKRFTPYDYVIGKDDYGYLKAP